MGKTLDLHIADRFMANTVATDFQKHDFDHNLEKWEDRFSKFFH